MADCAFCRIARGELDAHVLYGDERTVAFLDADPAARGHTLVAPRDHHEHLLTEDATLSADVFRAVRVVALALYRTLDPDGVSLFYTSADLVGRVNHAHVHLLPRYADDDIRLSLARTPLDEDDAARLAARVRENL